MEEQIMNFISYSAKEVSKNIILVGNKEDIDNEQKR
jgi:hypothetical protein